MAPDDRRSLRLVRASAEARLRARLGHRHAWKVLRAVPAVRWGAHFHASGAGFDHGRAPRTVRRLGDPAEHGDVWLLAEIAALADAALATRDPAKREALCRELERHETKLRRWDAGQRQQERDRDARERGRAARHGHRGVTAELIRVELAQLADLERVAALDAPRVARELAGYAADVQELLGGSPGQARQMLRKLFAGHRIACVPFVDPDGTRGYDFQAEGTYAALLAGRRVVNDGGVPDGTRQQRDSHASLPPTPRLCQAALPIGEQVASEIRWLSA